MKPIIGITIDCQHDPEDVRTRGKLELNWNYAQSISDAGGVPILIPPTADMSVVAEMIHGWLIPGGDDIDAAQFGEENHPKVSLQDPARFAAEQQLLSEINPDLPVFGICYGCQFINVTRGGTLIQHLPDVVGHSSHTGGTMQEYQIDEGSHLHQLIGESKVVGKSYHHQAVKDLGQGLTIVSHSEDGTVEAIEANDHPWMIGVQWHPERTLESAATQNLFAQFIKAASEYAERKQTVNK